MAISLAPSNVTEGQITLPPDVLELIFDSLAFDSNVLVIKDILTDHLRACCLVSRSWVPLCRSRLFKDVELGLGPVDADHRRRLAQVIEKQPSIGTFIRKITYTFGPFDGDRVFDEETEGRDECLRSLLGLPNVRRLIVLGYKPQDYGKAGLHYFGWRLLMDHYLSSGQLTSVAITGVSNLPLLYILSYPPLEDLSLSMCSISDSPNKTQSFANFHTPTSRLISFQAHMVQDLWWPLLAIICPKLKLIKLSVIETHVENGSFYLQTVPAISFPRVTSLYLNGIECCEYIGKSGNAMFPALIKLNTFSPFFSVKTSGIKSFPAFDQLETITFKVHPVIDQGLTLDTFDWDILAILVNSSLESLTHLRLEIILPGSAQHFLMRLSEILAGAKRKNVLQSLKLVVDDCSSSTIHSSPSQLGWKTLADTLVDNRKDFTYLQHVYVEFSFGCERHYMNSGVKEAILADPLKRLTACPDINFEYYVFVDYY